LLEQRNCLSRANKLFVRANKLLTRKKQAVLPKKGRWTGGQGYAPGLSCGMGWRASVADGLYVTLKERDIAPEREAPLREVGIGYIVDLATPCRDGTVTIALSDRPTLSIVYSQQVNGLVVITQRHRQIDAVTHLTGSVRASF